MTNASPFKTYLPPRKLQFLIDLCRVLPPNWIGKRLAFLLRRVTLFLLQGRPVDTLVLGANMRIFPYHNTSESRILFTPQLFDSIERTEIAKRVFKDKASITRIIDLLESNGYVERIPHPTHGKMTQINITQKGNETIDMLKKEVPKFRDFALKNISEDQKQETQAVLKSIIYNCI